MLKVQKTHIMLPFKNFQDTGHYRLASTFSRIVYSSVYLKITNTSSDWLTKGLDLKTFCCFVKIVQQHITTTNIDFVEGLYKEKW